MYVCSKEKENDATNQKHQDVGIYIYFFFWKERSNSYIDEVLLEALAQVVNKGHFAGVVLQQDKVLHSHPIPGCQGALHHRPHTVTAHRLTHPQRDTAREMPQNTHTLEHTH